MEEKSFVSWIKEHKKELFLIGISVTTLVVVVLMVKNKEKVMELWKNLQKEINEANKYSSKWLKMLTEEELSAEREKVRIEYNMSGDDYVKACRLENLLGRIDEEISRRAWGDRTPQAPTYHREHGWYLPNDD